MADTVLLERADGLATLTLNRPERLNAIDLPMLERLVAVLDEVGADPEVRCVVLTGSGRGFCAGADQQEMHQRSAAEWEWIVERYLAPVRRLADMDKPVIARLQGDAFGGGLGLALACDLRIAAEGVRLCAPFVTIGLAGCDMSAGWYLPRLIGLGRATEMMMTGRAVPADEAARIGLVTRTVPADALDEAVQQLAGRLLRSPTTALAFTKRAIRRSLDRDREGEFDFEVFAQVQCLQSEGHRAALEAFQARRRSGGSP